MRPSLASRDPADYLPWLRVYRVHRGRGRIGQRRERGPVRPSFAFSIRRALMRHPAQGTLPRRSAFGITLLRFLPVLARRR
jgi:hypothetical protein